MDMAPNPAPMTREAFLDWAERQELPYEFDGVGPVPMNGGSFVHFAIATRIAGVLNKALEGRLFEAVSAGFGVATSDNRVRFPDVVVIRSPCDLKARLAPYPLIVFELSSPTSVRIDRYVKAREYAGVPSILRFVILEQDSIDATIMSRTDGSAPWDTILLSRGEVLPLPEIGLEIPLDALYQGLDMPA